MQRRCWILVALGGLLVSCAPAMAKDLFVAVGSKDGDGSREAPCGTIPEALKRAGGGDKIHVSQGVHTGPGGCGTLRISTRDISLVGGYSEDFGKRDPWKYPTVLMRGSDPEWNAAACQALGCKHPMEAAKATYSPGPVVGQLSWAEVDGLVLDGFIIDGHTQRKYDAGGMMALDVSPATPVVAFSSPDVKILNCLILNGGQGIRLSGRMKNEVSNCLIVNTVGRAIDIQGKDALIKGNTVLFVWGTAKEQGTGVHVGVARDVQVEKNVFAYLAGTAVHTRSTEPVVTLKGNVVSNAGKGAIAYLSGEERTPATQADPAQLNGGGAVRVKAGRDSSGNKSADLAVAAFGDAGVLEKFAAAARGPVAGAAIPLMRYDQALLFAKDAAVAKAGAQEAGPFAAYREMVDEVATNKTYTRMRMLDLVNAADWAPFYGKDVEMVCPIGEQPRHNKYMAGKGLAEEEYVCAAFRLENGRKYLYGYVKVKTPSHKVMDEGYMRGQSDANKKFLLLKGTLIEPGNISSMYAKVVLVIDKAEFASDEDIEEATKGK